MSDLTPDDQALLERARRHGEATSDDHTRVKRKLFSQIGIGLGIGTSALSTSSGAGAGLAASGAAGAGLLGSAAKIVVALAIGAGIGTGVVIAHNPRSAHELPSSKQAAPVASSQSAPLPAAETSPLPEAPSRFSEPAEPRAPVEARPIARDRGASANPVDLPPANEQVNVSAPVPSPPPPPASTKEPQQVGPSTVGAEADLLRQADGALKAGNPTGALAILREHATRFPNGILVEEREAEGIVVLCALGRVADARDAASRFLRDRPHSPLARRVRESCGGF